MIKSARPATNSGKLEKKTRPGNVGVSMFETRLAGFCVATLLGCAPRPAAPVAAHEATVSIPSASKAEPPPPATTLGLRLIASFSHELEFAPMGRDTMLIAQTSSFEFQTFPILILDNQLRYAPALLSFSPTIYQGQYIAGIAGQWPHNAWIAFCDFNNMEWSTIAMYRWMPPAEPAAPAELNGGHWEEYYQHGGIYAKVAAWRDSVVVLDSAPVMIRANALELTATRARVLETGSCHEDILTPYVAPDGTLNLFLYSCDWMNEGADLEIVESYFETHRWSSAGIHTKQRYPLPPLGIKEVIFDSVGLALLVGKWNDRPEKLLRWVQGRWVTIADLPPAFEVLQAPGTSTLWGVQDGKLLVWTGAGWSATALPPISTHPELSWKSVWQRGPGDIWLIAQDPDGWHLFNTADGAVATPLPSPEETIALQEAHLADNGPKCATTFADFFELRSQYDHPSGFVEELPIEDATRLLQTAVRRHPKFRHLKFVRYYRRGDVVGAQVTSEKEADAFRAVLKAGAHASTTNRCKPPHFSTPLVLP